MNKISSKVTITSRAEFPPKALSTANSNLEIFEEMMSALGYKKVETEELEVDDSDDAE